MTRDIEDMTDAQDEARVTVKPLVWHDCADGTSHDDDCLYEIELDGKYWRLIRAVTGGGSYVGHHASRDAAKSAANKHHADRVNDWIADPSRPSQAGDERVARLVEALAAMLGRHTLYCGGDGLPFAGHTDVKLLEMARAALAAMDTPKGGGDE